MPRGPPQGHPPPPPQGLQDAVPTLRTFFYVPSLPNLLEYSDSGCLRACCFWAFWVAKHGL